MMNHPLVGKNIEISISEPWSLGESVEWVCLSGLIVAVGQSPTHFETVHDAILVKLDRPFEYKRQRCEWINGTARYEGSSVFDVLKQGIVPCNFTAISETRVSAGDVFNLAEWWRGGVSFSGNAELA